MSLNARAFPEWIRNTALIEARGRCREPGCDAPFRWLQTDHIKPHTKHGPTRLDNAQTLCDPHNKRKKDTWDKRRDKRDPDADTEPGAA